MQRKVLWQVKSQVINASIATVRTDIDGFDGVRANVHSNTAKTATQAGAVDYEVQPAWCGGDGQVRCETSLLDGTS